MNEFRYLNEGEIEVRVAQCSEKGASLLLYKDARVDARILDETVGPENWQCKYYEIKGNLFCSVGICTGWTEAGPNWVWKDDCGTPSNMESEKGEASDAFKRACFKWGIGRELYTAPFVWVPADKINLKQGRSGKIACYDRFKVERVKAEEGRIVGLAIRNESTGKRVFMLAPPTREEVSE